MLKTILTIFLFAVTVTVAFPQQPDNEIVYSRGLLQKSENHFNEAIETFSSLIALNKDLDRVYFQIASCYSSLADYHNATDFARKSIKANPQFTDPYQLIFDIETNLTHYDIAADILEELLENNPNLIQFQFMLGVHYFQNMQNYPMAALSFQKVLKIAKETTSPTYYREQSCIVLSDIYFTMQEYLIGISYIDQAVTINPNNNIRYYKYINTLIKEGRYTPALRCIESFLSNLQESQKKLDVIRYFHAIAGTIGYLSSDPKAVDHLRKGSGTDTIESFVSRQLFLVSIGKIDETLPVLEKITQSRPDYIAPFIALARIHLLKGKTENAYDEFLSAGSLLLKTDLSNAAASMFLEAMKIKPDSPDPLIGLAQAYENDEKNHLAAMYYIKYQEQRPDIDLLLHIAYLMEESGKNSRSNEYLQRAITMDPTYAKTYFFKGLFLSKDDNYSDAIIQFKKAIDRKTDDSSYYYYLAAAYENVKNTDESVNALKKAIELDPKNAAYLNFIGYLYADKNIQLDEAKNYIDSALAQDPNNGAYLDSIGWVYFRQGDNDQALLKLREAKRNIEATGDPDPVVYDHIGDVYNKAGDTAKALEYWKKSLTLKNDASIKNKIKSAERK